MPRVLNRHKIKNLVLPADCVYVGRPSKWGNPFQIGVDGDRDEVISRYETYLKTNVELLNSLHELRGKNLVCWCAPRRCHADVLLEYTNRPLDAQPGQTPKPLPGIAGEVAERMTDLIAANSDLTTIMARDMAESPHYHEFLAGAIAANIQKAEERLRL